MAITDEMSPLLPSFDSVKTTLYRERKKSAVSLVPIESEFAEESLKLDDIIASNTPMSTEHAKKKLFCKYEEFFFFFNMNY